MLTGRNAGFGILWDCLKHVFKYIIHLVSCFVTLQPGDGYRNFGDCRKMQHADNHCSYKIIAWSTDGVPHKNQIDLRLKYDNSN